MPCEDPPLPGPTRTASPPGSPEPASEAEQHPGQNRVLLHAAGAEEAHLLPEVHGEAHVPDVTLAVVEASQDGHVGLVGFDVVHVVLHFSWFPANDGVLTRLRRHAEVMLGALFKRWPVWVGGTDLGQNQVSEPPDTVHVVPVDVSSGEVGEVDLLGDEGPAEKEVSVPGRRRAAAGGSPVGLGRVVLVRSSDGVLHPL